MQKFEPFYLQQWREKYEREDLHVQMPKSKRKCKFYSFSALKYGSYFCTKNIFRIDHVTGMFQMDTVENLAVNNAKQSIQI